MLASMFLFLNSFLHIPFKENISNFKWALSVPLTYRLEGKQIKIIPPLSFLVISTSHHLLQGNCIPCLCISYRNPLFFPAIIGLGDSCVFFMTLITHQILEDGVCIASSHFSRLAPVSFFLLLLISNKN